MGAAPPSSDASLKLDRRPSDPLAWPLLWGNLTPLFDLGIVEVVNGEVYLGLKLYLFDFSTGRWLVATDFCGQRLSETGKEDHVREMMVRGVSNGRGR